MEFNSIEAIIIAMQSSQFSEQDKKEILIEYFKLMGYNQSTNNTSNKDSALKADWIVPLGRRFERVSAQAFSFYVRVWIANYYAKLIRFK